jgi:uncharacterized protein YjbJ (UPF0337 family)
MEEKLDEAKSRVKKAVGDLTDDDQLKNEGKVDGASSAVKKKVDDIADKAKEAVNPNEDDRDDR